MSTEPDPLDGLTDEEYGRLSGYPVDDYIYVRSLLAAERRRVRDIEVETARKIAEWLRPRGFIGGSVTAGLIERGMWKKP